jgi:8-oxo-dGTP pyrophosphatase MutT (NUDIX family)
MKKAVLAIIQKKGTKKFLLVKAKSDSNRKFKGCWMAPGGTLENKENHKETLIREIKEELGILIKPTSLIAETKGDNKNQIIQWWQCKSIPYGKKILLDDEELDGCGYFTLKEMENIPLWPATKKFFKKYSKNLNF